MRWLTRRWSSFWSVVRRLIRFRLVGFKTFLLISLFTLTIAGLSVASANPSPSQLNKIVDVYEEGALRSVPTRAETVGQLLERLEIRLESDDIVEPSLETPLSQSNFQVSIYRARPVRIVDGQEAITVRSAYQEPRLIVVNAGYELAASDAVSWVVSSDDLSLPLDTIEITRSLSTNTRIEPIPFRTVLTIDNNFPTCYSRLISLGKAGSKEVTYQTQSEGATTQSAITGEVILTQPINEQRVRGGLRSNFIADGDRRALTEQAGASAADWTYINYIFTRESRWNAAACNPSSAAFGLCQALPASKMATVDADYWTNPLTQMRWCHKYAIDRYGSWQNAHSFWLINFWW